MAETANILRVENLGISYRVDGAWIKAVRDFQLDLQPGEIHGIVGESGSGKSTVARGIMRYLSANGRTEPGSLIAFNGEDLTARNRAGMSHTWGAEMTLVPQNPTSALNPSIRVGKQVQETLIRHKPLSPAEAREQVLAAFGRVNLPDPDRISRRYPHELSGGQQQRVLIAMALITDPKLIILDEPTTGLDVTTEAVILDLVRALIRGENTGAIYVTHNLGVVAQLCERVTVMYAGEIMEEADVKGLYARPYHPYSIGLLNSIALPGYFKRERALQTIPGRPPSLKELPGGCVFAPRCPIAIDKCQSKPPLEQIADGRLVRCHRWAEIAEGTINPRTIFQEQSGALIADDVDAERPRLLAAEKITRHFPVPRSALELIRGEPPRPVRAVDDVTMYVRKGRTYGLVGESGSGKTTLSQVLIGLTERTAGSINLLGVDISGPVQRRRRDMLANLQMIFQNPQSSLNPYLTVGQAIRRPLSKLRGLSRAEADKELRRLLRAVNLRAEYAHRYPDELSGGEKQRVAIARAFASDPALIIADEPVSALDVSVQAAVLNLLATLQEENETSYIFISHDLAVVGYLADYIAVMYLGELFETGYSADLFSPPMHPYTEALVSAIPVADPTVATQAIRLSDVIPSPRNVPEGCRFHTRCPRKIGAICEEEVPPWREVNEGHSIRCHIPVEELRMIQGEGA